MRLFGRRRPAGVERVPNEVLRPELVDYLPGPVVLRLGAGLGLLDLPSSVACQSVANVWIADGRWVEAEWPRDATYGWFVAPIDLRLGHMLEFRLASGPLAGWVADVSPERFVFVITADRDQALAMARTAVGQWAINQIDRLR
ncbi:MAG: hypothetical protein R2710_22555 [Acidimicrobiales bacterium]